MARVSVEDCRAVLDMAALADSRERTSPEEATKLAGQLIGAYRARDFVDPQMFTVALVATLTKHPAVFARMVCDPVNGMVQTSRFAPSIAEVAEELDRVRERARRAERGARKLLQAMQGGAA